MNDSNILITMDTYGTPFALSLSTYLIDNAYASTYNSSDEYWAWVPVITQSERRSLVDWFKMMQNENMIIIPILLQGAPCPTVFEARYSIDIDDDTGELDLYFDILKDYLSHGQHLLNKLNKLEAHYQELDSQLKKSQQNLNLGQYLKDLRHKIDLTHKAMISPQALHDTNQKAIQSGLYNTFHDRQLINQNHHDLSGIVGNLQEIPDDVLKGWDVEIATIGNYLSDDNSATKIVSIIGQAGVGKTALAHHILDGLVKYDRLDNALYLNVRNPDQPLTLDYLFMVTGEVFDGAISEVLSAVWNNKEITLETRIGYLIAVYVDNPCLLILDNLEANLTAEGQFVDLEFTQFINHFLERDHQAKILITSRSPLMLDDVYVPITEVVPLSMGLYEVAAIQLLHDLDKDGMLGLHILDPITRLAIINHTKGYPRALEAIVGILVNRPLLTVDDILDFTPSSEDDSFVLDWVNRAEEVLDDDQRMVMQALSVFVEPVDEIALRFLLAPYLEKTGIDISFTLERLQRGRFIVMNKMADTFSIHPLDRDYNYARIQDENTNDEELSAGEQFLREMNILPPVSTESSDDMFTRTILENRAGDYYAHLRGQPDDWKTIHDLQPFIYEYWHRLRSQDYDTSFSMLVTVYNLLKLSGFAHKLVEMILPLIDHLSRSYKITCYNMLGMTYDDLGDYQESLNCHLSALPLTRREDNLPAEAAHLSGIGLQNSNLGEYEQALDYYEQALSLSRKIGNRKQERSILNNIAVVYNSIGHKLEGLETYEQSLDIAREIDDQQGVAVTLANIGDSYGALGNVDKTIECYQEAIDIYVSTGDKVGRGVTIGKMGNAAAMLASYDDALKLLDIAVEIAQHVGNQMWEVLHKADIAAVYGSRGDCDKGIGLLEEIIPEAEDLGTPIVINYIYSVLAGLLLYAGQFEKASTASKVAIQYTNPGNQHYEYALFGLIQVRLEKIQEARNAFYTSLDHAAELLENTPNLYSPKYSRGLALMGLALVTSDTSYVEDSKLAYIEARKNCDAKGIVRREDKKLKLLTWGIDGGEE
jgi:tetratricopeptide (TPR) repeat protein